MVKAVAAVGLCLYNEIGLTQEHRRDGKATDKKIPGPAGGVSVRIRSGQIVWRQS